MSQHGSHEAHRVHQKPRDPGSAHAVVHHERRHKSIEGKYGVIGNGADLSGSDWTSGSDGSTFPGVVLDANGLTAFNAAGQPTMTISAADGSVTISGTGIITGATIRTNFAFPNVIMDQSGIRAYNAGGILTMQVSAADGSVTINGTGVITGGTFQTSVSFPRLIMDGSGLRAYDSFANQTFNLSATDGSLTISGTGVITGATIQTAATGARVVMDKLGIRAYNASNIQTVNVDATTGLMQATGIIQSLPGSTVPWQTTGFFVGGGNLMANASAEDPTTVYQILYTTTGSVKINLLGGIGGWPSFESGVSGMVSDGSGTVVQSSAQSFVGNSSALVTAGSTPSVVDLYYPAVTANPQVTPGITYTLSAYSRAVTTGRSFQVFIQWFDSGSNLLSTSTGSSISNNTTGWTRATVTALAPTNAAYARCVVSWTGAAVGEQHYVDAGQFEVGSTATSYSDGTFTLQYPGSTATTTLRSNATSSQIQSALNSTGVLPAGVSAACSGGPLPSNDIKITLTGFATPAPSVITVLFQSVSGGSIMVGANPQPVNPGGLVFTAWATNNASLDFIPYPNAFHGGNVYRLTAKGSGAYMDLGIGPFAPTPGTTRYTFSVYIRSRLATRPALLDITWVDAFNNPTGFATVATSWNTSSSQWQRALITDVVPVAPSRQMIASTGVVSGGSFTLSYNQQITSPLSWNSTAAQVLSALQALSGVGANGVGYATGGPLPGTPVSVTFLPGAARISGNSVEGTALGIPADMAANSAGLTGGGSIVISDSPTIAGHIQITIPSSASGEIYYVDAIQFEVGDVATAFAPKPDEIVANTVTANMINVGLLSAISANLGTVTAGTITGATVQTNTANPRIVFNSLGLNAYNSAGTNTVNISSSTGNIIVSGGSIVSSTVTSSTITSGTINSAQINLTAGGQYIQWTASGVNHCLIRALGSANEGSMQLHNNRAAGYGLDIFWSASSDSGNSIRAAVLNGGASILYSVTLVDGTGSSFFGNLNAGRYFGPPGTPGVSLTDNNGHIITMAWTGTILQFYVDGTAVSTSDIRYKQDISPIHNALRSVTQLRGITYRWDHPLFDKSTIHHGLVAQEVQPIVPDAVSTHLDKDGEVVFALDERPIVPLLVEAIKELVRRVDTLEANQLGNVIQKLVSATDFQRAQEDARNEMVRTLEEQHLWATVDGREDLEELEHQILSMRNER